MAEDRLSGPALAAKPYGLHVAKARSSRASGRDQGAQVFYLSGQADPVPSNPRALWLNRAMFLVPVFLFG